MSLIPDIVFGETINETVARETKMKLSLERQKWICLWRDKNACVIYCLYRDNILDNLILRQFNLRHPLKDNI